MNGYNIAEQAHVAVLRYPIDLDSSQQSAQGTDWIAMKNAAHASIILVLGVTGATVDVKVQAATDASGTGAADIAFSVYKAETAASDVMGSRVAVAAGSTFTTSGNDNITYVIEIDAADLGAGNDFFQVHITDPGAATIGTCIAVLSGLRHGANLGTFTAQS